ncbi:DUF3410 domain-containing protein [Halomonas sp. 707D7]|uniref:DUF3410 domain-containing protein n=1 Tax=Halomonas sp. 707D7 TaxID=1681044 RepID=UPI0034612ADC
MICLHVPLVRDGAHATRHLLDEARIKALSSGCVLINAGRGDCVDGAALTQRLASAADLTAVLDVWESEPAIDAALRDQVALATPHIAGHSLDGKLRGTFMIPAAMMAAEGEPARLAFADICPPPALAALELRQALSFDQALALCVRAVYDVRRDHEALARAIERQGMAQGFDACRTHYPLRREFATLEVRLAGEAVALEAMLRGAGFAVTRG